MPVRGGSVSGEALKDSGISMEQEDPYRVGVSVGSGIGKPAGDGERAYKTAGKGSEPDQSSAGAADDHQYGGWQCGHQFGLKGKCINVVTACATGTHSIGEAFRSIQYGEADVMVAGGTWAP